jgi:hypothetical protein
MSTTIDVLRRNVDCQLVNRLQKTRTETNSVSFCMPRVVVISSAKTGWERATYTYGILHTDDLRLTRSSAPLLSLLSTRYELTKNA